jgi:thiol-disulfide isomerase/thioredoxin
MKLETMTPDPSWDPGAHPDAVETLAALGEEYVFHVWGDDGCGDCRERLPAFGAAVEAASIPDERVVEYPVERLPEGKKRGPKVEEYGIERIPTVVVERDGEEVARFVEEEALPIPEYLAERLREVEASA